MKHEVTNQYTKRALADSLKKALRSKRFSRITVTEIIQDCGVNRKTFYYHFEDIYALLKWMLDKEAVEVIQKFDLLLHYEDAIRFVMDYVDENPYIISCVYDSIGREEMKRFFYADMLGVVTSVILEAQRNMNIKIDSDMTEYAAKFYTEAIAGMLIDWSKNKEYYDREKVIRYLTALINSALESMRFYGTGQ